MEERVPPRFRAGKSKHKKTPTKRHLEDKLIALRRDLERYNRYYGQMQASNFFKSWVTDSIKRVEKRIAKIEKELENFS